MGSPAGRQQLSAVKEAKPEGDRKGGRWGT